MGADFKRKYVINNGIKINLLKKSASVSKMVCILVVYSWRKSVVLIAALRIILLYTCLHMISDEGCNKRICNFKMHSVTFDIFKH